MRTTPNGIRRYNRDPELRRLDCVIVRLTRRERYNIERAAIAKKTSMSEILREGAAEIVKRSVRPEKKKENDLLAAIETESEIA